MQRAIPAGNGDSDDSLGRGKNAPKTSSRDECRLTAETALFCAVLVRKDVAADEKGEDEED